MKRLALIIFLLVYSSGFNVPLQAYAAQEADHPYFHSEEFKKTADHIESEKAELQKLEAELKRIQEEKSQLATVGMGFLETISFLPFFSHIILLLSLSLLFIIVYLIYVKKFNPAKWFVLFTSHGNFIILFKSLKKHNTLLVLLCVASLFIPCVCLAATDILTDAKFYFFGNEIQKGYILVKYPIEGRNLSYDKITDIKVYPHFEPKSFEHQYNYLVHEFAIGFPPKAAEILKLIEKCRTIENLQTVYIFIFRLDDPTIKEVVQKRLDILTKVRSDIKFAELEMIVNGAKETNHLNTIREDVASSLYSMLPEATGASGFLQFSYLLVDIDPAKARELFEKVKYKFDEIISNDDNQSRFRAVYGSLSKTKPEIYGPGDSLQLDDMNEPVRMVSVAHFFDTVDERVASTIVKNFHLERTTKINQEAHENLIDLWKKYRKEEVPAFFNYYTGQFVKFSKGNLALYMKIADRMGYGGDQAMDALIKADSDYNGLKSDSSPLLTRDFMGLMSEENLGKHFEYLKSRTSQAPVILESLLQKRYDLFLDYLEWSFERDPHLVLDLTFENKLVGLSKLNGIVKAKSIKDFRLPSSYYLLEKELSGPAPNQERIKALIQKAADDRLESMLLTDNKLPDSGFLDELVLFSLCAKLSDPQFADRRAVFESSVGLQTQKRMSQLVSAIDSDVQHLRNQVQQSRSELDRIKSAINSARVRIIVLWILLIILIIYILAAFVLSIKYSINAVSSYSGTKVALFALVFTETFAKFLTPILYFTVGAILTIIFVQLYGFLRSKDGEFPHVQQSLANYRDNTR